MASKDSTAEAAPTKLYTRAEVAKQNDSDNIGVIIHDKVYNITAFLNEHPGGAEVLLALAGQDCTEPFEDIGHSSDARQLLETYKVGELVEEEKTDSGGNEGEKKNWAKYWASGNSGDDSNSGFLGGSWRSWLYPVALGILATLVYRYFISAR